MDRNNLENGIYWVKFHEEDDCVCLAVVDGSECRLVYQWITGANVEKPVHNYGKIIPIEIASAMFTRWERLDGRMVAAMMDGLKPIESLGSLEQTEDTNGFD